jgi:hypothetical protein
MQEVEIDGRRIEVSADSERSRLLGRIVWYSVSSEPVRFEDLENALRQAAVPEVLFPKRTRPVDAFKDAVRTIARRDYVVEYDTTPDGKKDFTTMVIASKEVDTIRDALPVQMRVVFDAGTNTILPVANGPGLGPILDLFDRIQRRFDTLKQSYTDRDIRTLLSTTLKSCYAIMLKRHGGIYFVPESYAAIPERLSYAIKLLNETVGGDRYEMVAVPVINRETERETLVYKYERETRQRIDDLLVRVSARVESGEPIYPSHFKQMLEEVQYLEKQRGHYEELLESDMSKVEIEFDVLKSKMRDLSELVKEKKPSAEG